MCEARPISPPTASVQAWSGIDLRLVPSPNASEPFRAAAYALADYCPELRQESRERFAVLHVLAVGFCLELLQKYCGYFAPRTGAAYRKTEQRALLPNTNMQYAAVQRLTD